jgi:hypothetical protein
MAEIASVQSACEGQEPSATKQAELGSGHA